MNESRTRADWQPVAGVRMTPAMAAEMIIDFESSGLSVAEFSRRHGLQKQRLSHWRSRLHEIGADKSRASEKKTGGERQQFTQVVETETTSPLATPSVTAMQTLEATLPSGSRIVVHGVWDVASIRLWLTAMGDKSC